MTLLVVGDLNLDVQVRARAVAVGSDVPGEISLRGGGSAANVAVWASRLGQPTRFVGAVGDDEAGRFLREGIREPSLDTHLLVRPSEPSRVIAVWIHPDGNRSIVSDRESQVCLVLDDFDSTWFAGVSWLHLTGYTLITKRSRRLFLHLMAEARKRGVPISFDPSAAFLLRRTFSPAEVLEATAGARLVFPSRDEAEFLTGAADPAAAAEILRRHYACVVITCDRDGALVVDDNGSFSIAPPEIDVRDATGAGDAFAAGFLVSFLAGASVQSAGSFAAQTAGRALSLQGARPELAVEPALNAML